MTSERSTTSDVALLMLTMYHDDSVCAAMRAGARSPAPRRGI
ncbi:MULTISPECIES: hypothetical protein [unclassified Nonomuraea]|nr:MULTISPECIES: hypothetical protein [unclassified Nonomuraea]